jgi:hypothetical protein
MRETRTWSTTVVLRAPHVPNPISAILTGGMSLEEGFIAKDEETRRVDDLSNK